MLQAPRKPIKTCNKQILATRGLPHTRVRQEGSRGKPLRRRYVVVRLALWARTCRVKKNRAVERAQWEQDTVYQRQHSPGYWPH